MKDTYLHSFRREPDQEFTHKLYQRLMRLPATEAAPLPQPPYPRKLRLAWAFTILIMSLAVMAMVPGVRARFEEIVQQVGGLTLFLTENYPGTDNPHIVPNDLMTLEEARAHLDFEFNLPTWLPEGLVMGEEVIYASTSPTSVSLLWRDENSPGRSIYLSIEKAIPDAQFIVGPDSITPVQINSATATLIRGSWNADTKEWLDDGSRALRWQSDGVTYYLSTGSEAWGGLSDEELIKVAESIP